MEHQVSAIEVDDVKENVISSLYLSNVRPSEK